MFNTFTFEDRGGKWHKFKKTGSLVSNITPGSFCLVGTATVNETICPLVDFMSYNFYCSVLLNTDNDTYRNITFHRADIEAGVFCCFDELCCRNVLSCAQRDELYRLIGNVFS